MVKISDDLQRDEIALAIKCLPEDATLVGCFVDHPHGHVNAFVFQSEEFREAPTGAIIPELSILFTRHESGDLTAKWEYWDK